MSHQDTREGAIAGILVGLAGIYDKELHPEAFVLYSQALIDLSVEDIKRAVVLYLEDAKNDKFPRPAQLKAALSPTDEQQARDAVTRIIHALTKWSDPYGHSDERRNKAKEYIGELGWIIVQRQGGWEKLSVESDLGHGTQAQWRESMVSFMSKARLGILDEAPKLPSRRNEQKSLENLSFLPKLIDK